MFQRLNYTTSAINDLITFVQNIDLPVYAPDRQSVIELIGTMRAASKFTLPNKGQLIFDEGDMPKGTEVCRLPFPITLIEFPFQDDASSRNEKYSTRRIAVAREARRNADNSVDFVSGKDADGFTLSVVSYIDVNREWVVMPALVWVDYATASTTSTVAYKMADSRSSVPMTLGPLLPTFFELARSDPKLGFNALAHDVARETNIFVEFLAVMACSNVDTDTDVAPERLNRQRLLTGKEPFYDYKVLLVGEGSGGARGSNRSNDLSTGDTKVRTHLRRGHIRRLFQDTRRIWINATVVAPTSALGSTRRDFDVVPVGKRRKRS